MSSDNFLKKKFTKIIDVFFNQQDTCSNPLVKHHIDSMNKFFDDDIENIITEKNPMIGLFEDEINHITVSRKSIVKFSNPIIEKPMNNNINGKELYPNSCRMFNKSYTCNLYVNWEFELFEKIGDEPWKLREKFNSNKDDDVKPLLIGEIPCMLKSKYCNLFGFTSDTLKLYREDENEYGGYFIINGQEFVIISQEQKATNFIYRNMDEEKKDTFSVWIQSRKSGIFQYPYYTFVKIDKLDNITITVDIFKKSTKSIPLKIMYKALGIIKDQDIYNFILGKNNDNIKYNNLLYHNLIGSENIITQNQALLWIGKRMMSDYQKSKNIPDEDIIENTRITLLNNRLFPHIETTDIDNQVNIYEKTLFLSHMVKIAIDFKLGILKPIDKDNYGNKRIFTSGPLYGQIFKYNFDMQINDFTSLLKKRVDTYNMGMDFKTIIPRIIGGVEGKFKLNNIATHISRGEWPAGKTTQFSKATGSSVRKGIAQSVERKGSMDLVTALNRVAALVSDQSAQVLSMHLLHNSQMGTHDPWNTPDGQSVGIIKHKTPWVYISDNFDFNIVIMNITKYIKYVLPVNTDLTVKNNYHNLTKVFINGNIKFCVKPNDRVKFVNELKELRRANKLYRYISIILYYEENEVRIYTDTGRMLQCMLIVDKGNKLRITPEIFEGLEDGKYDWQSLLTGYNLPNGKPVLEFISIHEKQKNVLLAENLKNLRKGNQLLRNYTHCLIDETTILDLNSCQIPYANFNPAARVTYQNSMSKQSIGIHTSNYNDRFDKTGHILQYLERPQVSTIGGKYTLMNKYPAGMNATVALCPVNGLSQEDAIVFNENSIQNGMGAIYSYKTVTDKIVDGGIKYMKPIQNQTDRYKTNSNYDALNRDGRPKIGHVVRKGDIILGKVKKLKLNDRQRAKSGYIKKYIDMSISYKEINDGVIDKIERTMNNKQEDIIKIRIRLYRFPIIGDKFATRIAQKGVISAIVPAHNLPYTEDGVRADIYFNPHGFTTRMTMSLLIEILISIIGSKKGIIFDGTPFNGTNIEKDIIPVLQKLGFEDNGDRVMYDGFTGRKMKVKIFMGPMYYQRLKHMVNDKVNSHSRGRYMPLTKQPLSGRQIPGGGALRFGTMENDSQVAFGTAYAIKGILYDKSDAFRTYVSNKTGLICSGNDRVGFYRDKASEETTSGAPSISQVDICWTSIIFIYYCMMLGIAPRLILDENKI